MRPVKTRYLPLVVLFVVGACSQTPDRPERERTMATPNSEAAAQNVTVPDVRHSTTRAADNTLRQAGLLLQVDPVGGDDAVVISQRPDAGRLVSGGSVVTVEARCHPAPCPYPGEGKEIYDPCTCAAR